MFVITRNTAGRHCEHREAKNKQTLMKKFITFLSLIMIFSIALPTVFENNDASAQIVTLLRPTAADDTLTNTDEGTVYIGNTQAAAISSTTVADNITRSATVVITKVSGTAAGTVTFYGSADGTNYTALTGTLGGATALTITDVATQQVTFPLRATNGDLLFKHYKVVVASSGTCVIIPKVYVLRRSN